MQRLGFGILEVRCVSVEDMRSAERQHARQARQLHSQVSHTTNSMTAVLVQTLPKMMQVHSTGPGWCAAVVQAAG